MLHIAAPPEKQPLTSERLIWFVLSLIVGMAIGLVDRASGYELNLSLVYTAPILLALRKTGRLGGYLLCLLCAGIWCLVNHVLRPHPLPALMVAWNAVFLLGFFLLLTYTLDTLYLALRRESRLARVDHLTGAANARLFYERAEEERRRARRTNRPLTLAYLDLDNFKRVNDRLGHAEGDELLRKVARIVREGCRASDLLARVGGDEFALLLPETDGEAARRVLERIRSRFAEAMASREWPVTCSIGAVTFRAMPESIVSMVTQADDLMYEAKEEGKDRLRLMEGCAESPPASADRKRPPSRNAAHILKSDALD